MRDTAERSEYRNAAQSMSDRDRFVITVDDAGVQSMLKRLGELGANIEPVMQEIGEQLVETTKQRFDSSSAPDGSAWAPNTATTLERFLAKFSGSYKKDGARSVKGERRATGKKPLVGESGALRTTISYQAGADFVEIGSNLKYSAVQQFGAAARSFTGGRSPWGDIPARPFIGLSDDDADWLRERLSRALADAAAPIS